MSETKDTLRARTAVARKSLSRSEVDNASRLIQQRAIESPVYLRAAVVALYSPIGNEVATGRLYEHARKADKKIFYPESSDAANPRFVLVAEGATLAPGRYGVLEPPANRTLTGQEQAEVVVFVPGLAFDRCGNRLGRGDGWYDRALSSLGEHAVLIGLAYEFQVFAGIPADSWDRRVHYVITERRMIDCRKVVDSEAVSNSYRKGGVDFGN